MGLVKARKFTYVFSLVLMAASIAALTAYGLRLGIDFTGGSILEIEYLVSRPPIQALEGKIREEGVGQVLVQVTGERGVLLRMQNISEQEHQKLISALLTLGEARELRFDSIGPTIGKELRERAIWATALVLAAIILYIAWAFRKVSKPVSSWLFGFFAVTALFHDILIPLGVFSVLGRFKGVEIDTLFVTAILTVLGFSVHDTIVVYDRVRENLKLIRQPVDKNQNFEEVVGKSLSQTLVRSINTSLTVLIVLTAIFFFGAESTKYFSLALIIGIIAGTYSSIFIASPLLVTWNNFRKR